MNANTIAMLQQLLNAMSAQERSHLYPAEYADLLKQVNAFSSNLWLQSRVLSDVLENISMRDKQARGKEYFNPQTLMRSWNNARRELEKLLEKLKSEDASAAAAAQTLIEMHHSLKEQSEVARKQMQSSMETLNRTREFINSAKSQAVLTPIELIRQLLAAMEMREATGQRPANYDELMHLATNCYSMKPGETEALLSMHDALSIQDKRETEEFHLSPEAMSRIWNKGKQDAIEVIKSSQPRPAVNRKASQGLKLRSNALAQALSAYEGPLSHSQALHVLAKMYGYQAYHALRHATSKPQPAFCPHCGVAGMLTPGVHAPDATIVSYVCQSCSGTFSAARQSADIRQPE